MKQCILHVGMPKTGTTSIQESLHDCLTDPAFRYFSFGEVNGSKGMATLFRAAPETYHTHQKLGWSSYQIAQYRKKLHQQLEAAMTNAAAEKASLILSAESCWQMSRAEFTHIRNFMADRGYIVKVVGYIRHWKQWLESNFQQRIKDALKTFQAVPVNPIKLDYRGRIQELEAVFGAEQVQIYLYDPQNFPAGCVVRDFCQRLGIKFDFTYVRRVNDSLKLSAVQFLYAYRKFGPGYGTGRQALAENTWLIQQVSQLSGPPLRFHSSLLAPIEQELARQRPWLEQRLGHPFVEDIYCDDDAICIRQEADLFDFAPAALGWLAAATHNAPVDPATGEQAALGVSAQMHQLRLLGAHKIRFKRLLGFGKRQLLRLKQLDRNFDSGA